MNELLNMLLAEREQAIKKLINTINEVKNENN